MLILSFESIATEDPPGSDHEMGLFDCGMGFYFFHPNQTKTLHCYVENQGIFPDSYMINFTIDDPRWSWELDRDFFPDVPGSGKRYFNLSMTSPIDGKAGQYTNATLTASSMTVNLTESFSWRSFIIVERDVNLECADCVKETDSGDVTIFELRVRNIGDLEDTYRIEYTLQDPDLGWGVEVSEELLKLDVKESGNFTVRLTAPWQGVENFTVFLRVQSTNDASVWDGKKLICQVRRVWSASIEPKTGNWTIGPGQIQEVSLELAQLTNDPKAHDWDVEILFNPNGWEAWTDPSGLTVSGTGKANLTVYVLSPEDISIGRKLTLAVVLRCKQLPLERVRADLGFQIGEVHALKLGYTEWQVKTSSGEVVSFMIRADNSGNTQEVFQVMPSGPDGWVVEAWTDEAHDGWFSVEPGRSLSMDLRVKVPEQAPPGNYWINATLRSNFVESNTIALAVEVLKTQRIQLGPIEQKRVVMDLYGQQLVVEVPLYNKGNSMVKVFLEAKTYNESFNVIIVQNGLVLGPGEVSRFYLGLSVDDDVPFGDGSIALNASVDRSNVSDTLNVPVTVVGPDIKIQSVSFQPTHLKAGEPVTVKVRIPNDGRGSCPRFNVTLKGPFFGGDPEPVVIPPLGPGENATATFIVKPMSGTYRWIFDTDPDDSVREDHESGNNHLEYKKTIFPSEDPPNPLPSIASIIILLLVVVLIYIIQRRPRPRQPTARKDKESDVPAEDVESSEGR
jgi:uncharacterized membrane protein